MASEDIQVGLAHPGPGKPGLRRPLGWLIAFLLAVTAFRVFYVWAGVYDLSGDEATYWDYIRHPQWCYYFKGPVVAWCIWLGTAAFGNTHLGVRLPAILLSAGSSLLLYALGRRVYNAKVGAWAAGLYQVTPLFAFNSLGMTIDPPYVFLCILAMLLTHAACREPRAWKWLALGGTVGLGLMTKYTMVLFYPCALLYLVTSGERRRLLARPGPWIAVAVSLAFLAPLLRWDSQHGWVNLAHNLGHAEAEKGLRLTPGMFGEFLGSQLLFVTPMLLVMMLIALSRRRKTDGLSFWFSVPILAFFALKSLQGRVYENWAMAAYPAGFIAFAAVFVEGYAAAGIHVKRLTRTAIIVAAAGALLMHVPMLPSLVGFWKVDPTRQLQGWREAGREVSRLEADVSPKHFIITDRRQLTSLTAFYVEGNPRTFCLRKDPREVSNDYDLWPGFDGLLGYDALYVTYETGKPARIAERFAAAFDQVEERRFDVNDFRGRPIRKYAVFLCRNFRGMPADQDEPATRSAEDKDDP